MPHFYALTSDGKLISALEAEGAVNYYCSHCHAIMRVRKSITRSPHFFLHDDYHKSRDCKAFEKEQNVIRTPTLIKPEKFAHSVLFPRSRKNQVHKEGDRPSATPHSSNEQRPPNSIRQLVICGAKSMDPNTPIDGGILADIYVGPKSYNMVLRDNKSLGFRVIHLWLDSAHNNRIRYAVVWTYRGKRYRAFFEHIVSDNIDFIALADALFHDKYCNYRGTFWRKSKYKTIAIGGDWSYIEREFCQTCCTSCQNPQYTYCGTQEAQLNHLDQIYYSDLPDNCIEA